METLCSREYFIFLLFVSCQSDLDMRDETGGQCRCQAILQKEQKGWYFANQCGGPPNKSFEISHELKISDGPYYYCYTTRTIIFIIPCDIIVFTLYYPIWRGYTTQSYLFITSLGGIPSTNKSCRRMFTLQELKEEKGWVASHTMSVIFIIIIIVIIIIIIIFAGCCGRY